MQYIKKLDSWKVDRQTVTDSQFQKKKVKAAQLVRFKVQENILNNLIVREMSNQNTLDLHHVQQSFHRSLKEEDDVVVEAYIDGYNELVKWVKFIVMKRPNCFVDKLLMRLIA